MKCLFYILIFLVPTQFFAQEKDVKLDTVSKSEKDTYIIDYTNRFNVKFELSNDILKFKIPFDENSVNVEPNLSLRYAVVLSYKFASIRIGFRTKASGVDKGEKGKLIHLECDLNCCLKTGRIISNTIR